MRLALGVLAAAAGLWAMTRRSSSGHHPPQPRYADQEHASEPKRGAGPAAVQQPLRPALHATHGGKVPGDTHHQRKEREYWRRSLTVSWAAAGATLVAVFFAAGAYNETRRQADTAQEALVATTRAYVVLRAEVTTDEESKRPVFRFAAENMGQTPVRNLFFVLWDELLESPWGRPAIRDRVDCARSAGPSSTGLTFGKDAKYDMPIYARLGSPAEWERTVLVHGQACYRDVFGTAHTLPVCFLWHPGGGVRGVQCRYEGD